jgi:hypothetical protein
MGSADVGITGRVLDSEGNPVPDARVFYVAGSGPYPDIAALTDERGAYSLPAPAAGSYEIRCQADGYQPATHTIVVGPDRSAQADISLQKMP